MEREYKRRRHMDKNTYTEQHILITKFFQTHSHETKHLDWSTEL